MFKSIFTEENKKYSFNPLYKGFYDDRTIIQFDLDSTVTDSLSGDTLDELLTTDVLRLPMRIRGMEMEIQMLKQIALKDSGIQTFEFDNKKFSREEANSVLMKVHEESDAVKEALHKADKSIFLLFHQFCNNGENDPGEAIEMYKRLFNLSQSINDKVNEVGDILQEFGQLYQGNVTQDAALVISRNMTRKEAPVRSAMKELLSDVEFTSFISLDEKETLEHFLSKNWVYYTEPTLDSDAITLFVQAMNVYATILSKRAFDLKKQTLTRQLDVISGQKLEMKF